MRKIVIRSTSKNFTKFVTRAGVLATILLFPWSTLLKLSQESDYDTIKPLYTQRLNSLNPYLLFYMISNSGCL